MTVVFIVCAFMSRLNSTRSIETIYKSIIEFWNGAKMLLHHWLRNLWCLCILRRELAIRRHRHTHTQHTVLGIFDGPNICSNKRNDIAKLQKQRQWQHTAQSTEKKAKNGKKKYLKVKYGKCCGMKFMVVLMHYCCRLMFAKAIDDKRFAFAGWSRANRLCGAENNPLELRSLAGTELKNSRVYVWNGVWHSADSRDGRKIARGSSEIAVTTLKTTCFACLVVLNGQTVAALRRTRGWFEC